MIQQQIEILVEEPSMKNFLEVILPRILPDGYQLNHNCFIREHEGKQALQKAIPKKVKAYRNYSIPVKVIVIHDQDSSDCIILKEQLKKLVIENNDSIHFLIRIACKELESWYLGDMDAIQSVYPRFKAEQYKNWAKFRNPDACVSPANELEKLIPNFQKGAASKKIPENMDIENNSSHSFHAFITGIKKFVI